MPIAVWCMLAAGVLPILTTGLAKLGAAYDNRDPRDFMSRAEGYRRRAYAAHLNGFEGFPFFAAAVLAAQGQDAAQQAVDLLALLYVAARIAYVAAYIGDAPTLRSILWSVGFFTVLAIFTTPLWAGHAQV
jgi:uncharacterized MAPEG superfamily protein